MILNKKNKNNNNNQELKTRSEVTLLERVLFLQQLCH